MSHEQFVVARPFKKGEWVAELKINGEIVATSYGLSREETVQDVSAKAPHTKRFTVRWENAKKSHGAILTVTDTETGDQWCGSGHSYDDARNEVYPQLPKAFFKQEYGATGQYKYADFHVFKKMGIPAIVAVIVVSIVMYLISLG